jgi:acetyl esterase/lipase
MEEPMVNPLIRLVPFLVALLPALSLGREPKPEVQVERGLVFGKGADVELKLDLAMPKEGDGPFPAVVCIHGGGWVGGDRGQMAQTIETLARCGYVAVSPDYRLAPKHHFPAPAEDCKAAVRWLRANAAKYKINPERIGAVGFSAGGHLACLLGVTDKGDGLEGEGGSGEHSSRVQAVVSFFGPTDFRRKTWSKTVEEKNLVPLLGGTLAEKPEAYQKASPLSYASKSAPPFLFFHGTEDKTVPTEQSQALADKLREAGVSAEVVLVEGEGHGWRGEKLLKSIDRMLIFLDEKLRK